MEVRYNPKYWLTKNKCCYCKRNALVQKTMTCGYECKKTFHVRCAILRGLIVDYETMREKQPDPRTGEPLVYCAKHTRLFRELGDDPDMQSQLTNMLGCEDGDEDNYMDLCDDGVPDITNPEDDHCQPYNGEEDLIGGAPMGTGPIDDSKDVEILQDEQNSFF